MRILVAEDETIIRLDLREILERAGFEVCAEAKDGLEAVELARSEEPDLAVLDVKMPRLDGIELPRERHGLLPVARLTDHLVPGALEQPAQVEADDRLVLCHEDAHRPSLRRRPHTNG